MSPDFPLVDPPVFTAKLRAHRSLDRRGFAVLMAVLAVASFGCGSVFLMIGAWPVFGFFGLDVFLIYLAFRRNFLDARAYEEIHLSFDRIEYIKVDASGDRRSHVFNPRWVRLHVRRDHDGDLLEVGLASQGVVHRIGSALGAGELEAFVDAFSRALVEARQPRTDFFAPA